MKALSTGNKKILESGNSTLEILIAFAVLTLCMTAVIMIGFGNQSISVDTQTNNEALSQAEKILEDARANARSNFISVISYATTSTSTIAFNQKLDVLDISECKKQATSTVSWSVDKRVQTISLATFLSSTSTVAALGGDCPTDVPDGWSKPRLFASYKFTPGQPISIDVLNRIAYVSDDKGKLNIADTNSATLGLVHGTFFNPSFDSTSTLTHIDAAKWTDPVTLTEKKYIYASRGHSSCNSGDNKEQFEIIDVTNPSTPSYVNSFKLVGGSAPNGSCPGGWLSYYYDNHVYITTRYTSGYEFHIFDVTTPTNAHEVGPGFDIGGTANDIKVVGITINNKLFKIAYMATDRSAMELMAVDVSDSLSPSLLGSIDLPDCPPTYPNGLSIYVLGNRIYIGRQNTSCGPELYVYDANYSVNGLGKLVLTLSPVGSGGEIGTDINHIIISGKLAFLATSKANDEFEVWNISDPLTSISRIDTSPVNLPNKIVGGMDYESPYIYVGSQATDPLQILYSSP